MQPGEKLRSYTDRYFTNRNTCVDIRDDQVIDYFLKGIKNPEIYEEICKARVTTISALMEAVNNAIETEDALKNQFNADGTIADPTVAPAAETVSKLRKRTAAEVLATQGRRPSTFSQAEFDEVMDNPCVFHADATHTLRECIQIKRAFAPTEPKRPKGGDRPWRRDRRYDNRNNRDDRNRRDNRDDRDRRDNRNRRDDRRSQDGEQARDDPNGPLPPPPNTGNPNGPFQRPDRTINIIVGGIKGHVSKRRQKKDEHEILHIHTKPMLPLRWSDSAITFSREDHWVHIPDPGSYPLVIEPTVNGAALSQTLIDGGSGLNIIFVETLRKMDFDFSKLTKTDEPLRN
jgi:hypothetical protein